MNVWERIPFAVILKKKFAAERLNLRTKHGWIVSKISKPKCLFADAATRDADAATRDAVAICRYLVKQASNLHLAIREIQSELHLKPVDTIGNYSKYLSP